MRRLSLTVAAVALICSAAHGGDVFDRHTTKWLKHAIRNRKAQESLSMSDAGRLKTLSADISSPCIVVKTDDGNLTKALVAWGFRRGEGKLVPVLLIERYVTYRSDRGDTTTAAGKDVMLFAGFSFNFDIGQVVPEGQGGDIRFTDKAAVETLADAQLFGLDGSQLPDDKPAPPGNGGVLGGDFTGTWTVTVDGRWNGEMTLALERRGKLRGKYTSAKTKSTYDVSGRIAALPHHAKLTIHLDNTQQSIDAFLFTRDKSTMAGSATLAGRKFGFYAIRENREKNSERSRN